MAVGGGGHPLVGVDVQDLLGRRIQRVHRPVGAGLGGRPGIHSGLHPGLLQDGGDLAVLAVVQPVEDVGHAEALDRGGEQQGSEELGAHGLPEAMLGALLLGGGLLDRVGQLHGGLLGAHPRAAGRQRGPAGGLDAGGTQGVDHHHLAQPRPVRQGGPEQVRLDAGGQEGPGPFQHPRHDQARGLPAAGGPKHQHRVAVLGGQQPTQQARGAPEDHPAGLGVMDSEQPQLSVAGPDRAGMLGRP